MLPADPHPTADVRVAGNLLFLSLREVVGGSLQKPRSSYLPESSRVNRASFGGDSDNSIIKDDGLGHHLAGGHFTDLRSVPRLDGPLR